MTHSLWTDTVARPSYPRLQEKNLHVDVAVVGGGITGVTTAFLLKAAGKRVALIEARTLGSGVTGETTAHLTEAIDTRYHILENRFGKNGARLVARSSRAAIEEIAELDARLGLRADFERLPGFLYTERAQDVDAIKQEYEAARRAGLAVELGPVPLPLRTEAGLRFKNQAQFSPMAYLLGVAARVSGNGSQVYEQTRVVGIDEGEPCRLRMQNGAQVTAERVVLATHAPLNLLLLQTKVASYRSYVIAGLVEHPFHGLFWDTDEPYHYIRSQKVGIGSYLVVGGEDHKTGQALTTEAPFDKLALYARRLGLGRIDYRWSGQVVEPADGLPLIGRNAMSEYVYVASGYSGNGATFGTLAAMLLCDACLDRHNPYAELYQATRIKPLASLSSFLGENVDFPLHLVSDRLRRPGAKSLEEIVPGQGKIVRVGGERMAVYRDDGGGLHAVSPVCTHLGCYVAFNPVERSWDCPCHGSRFGVDGEILEGPAVRQLPVRHIAGLTVKS